MGIPSRDPPCEREAIPGSAGELPEPQGPHAQAQEGGSRKEERRGGPGGGEGSLALEGLEKARKRILPESAKRSDRLLTPDL